MRQTVSNKALCICMPLCIDIRCERRVPLPPRKAVLFAHQVFLSVIGARTTDRDPATDATGDALGELVSEI